MPQGGIPIVKPIDHRAVLDGQPVHSLPDDALIRQCFAPLVDAYKLVAAQDGDVNGLYASFTDGQKALFAAQTFLSHAIRGTDEFHWRCLLFRTYPLRLQGMKSGVRLFGDEVMTRLLDDIAAAIEPVNAVEGAMMTFEEAERLLRSQPDYAFSIASLESRLHLALPCTYSLIASFIRNRAADFIRND